MCLVRMKQEGRTGKYMCRIIVHFMWEDVEQRGRVMGVSASPGAATAEWLSRAWGSFSFRVDLPLEFCEMLPNAREAAFFCLLEA